MKGLKLTQIYGACARHTFDMKNTEDKRVRQENLSCDTVEAF